MPPRRTAASLIRDLLTGLIAFTLAIAGIAATEQQDLRLFFAVTAVPYLAAGYIRGRIAEARPLTVAILVAAGGILPVGIMNRAGIGFDSAEYVLLFAAAALAWSAFGAWSGGLARTRTATAASLAAASLALLAVVTLVAIPGYVARKNLQYVNRAIAPFTIATLDGRALSSARDLNGHVVVLAFWATWCVPCRAELPEVARLQREFAGDPRVTIIALDTGTAGDTAERAQRFIAQRGLALAAAIDSVDPGRPDVLGSAGRSVGLSTIPAIYVLDAHGRLRITHRGYDVSEQLADNLKRSIRKLLEE